MSEKRDANGLTEAEFLKQYNSDIYPKPSLTADILVFRADNPNVEKVTGDILGSLSSASLDLLLIRRKGHPCIGQWALPGGFAERGETIEETAARELEEETGVTGLEMDLVGIYSKLGRDPRGWTVSAAYAAVVGKDQVKPKAGDDAREVAWATISVSENTAENDELTVQENTSTGNTFAKPKKILPAVCLDGVCINSELAFDHYEIITDGVNHVLKK